MPHNEHCSSKLTTVDLYTAEGRANYPHWKRNKFTDFWNALFTPWCSYTLILNNGSILLQRKHKTGLRSAHVPHVVSWSKGLKEYWLSWESCLFVVPVDEIISSAKLGLCLRESYAVSAQQPGDAGIAITTRKCANSRGGNGGSYLHDTQWQALMMLGLWWLTLVSRGRSSHWGSKK